MIGTAHRHRVGSRMLPDGRLIELNIQYTGTVKLSVGWTGDIEYEDEW